MTIDTKTYPFGETPVEVIRERHVATVKNGVDNVTGRYAIASYYLGTDDLLTVLDNAAAAATGLVAGYEDDNPGQRNRARKLRIEILAALGVSEE